MKAAGTAKALETERAALAQGDTISAAAPAKLTDDVHLSELIRSLRSLAVDSPELQAKVEQLTQACASASYPIDPQATAEAIINDAVARTKK